MSALNLAWMITVVQQAIDARDQGTNIFVGNFPEIADLSARGYLEVNKRKKDADGNWFAVAPAGLTIETVSAALNPATAAPVAPVVQEVQQPAPVAPVAEATAVTQQPAPAVADTLAPATAPSLAETAQPQFASQPAVTPAAGEVIIGQGLAHQTLNTVQNAENESFDIDVGVAYVKRSNIAALQNAVRKPRPEKYPFSVIANLKLDPANLVNPAFVPSFHIANKESKNISGIVTRNNDLYEKQGVTFRAQQVDANDPKGAGVRVFAMSVDQAPARKTANKKKAAAAAAVSEAPSAATLVDNGVQVAQPQTAV